MDPERSLAIFTRMRLNDAGQEMVPLGLRIDGYLSDYVIF
jgi:hypothetical protein